MSMTKKDFVALADAILKHNRRVKPGKEQFNTNQMYTLINFCKTRSKNFDATKWIKYINR